MHLLAAWFKVKLAQLGGEGNQVFRLHWLEAAGATCCFVMAHGAGAGMDHPFMDGMATALARHGVTFRHRIEDGAGLWQLKLPREAARLELELAGPPARPPA